MRLWGLKLVAGVALAGLILIAVIVATNVQSSRDARRSAAADVSVCAKLHRLVGQLDQVIIGGASRKALLRFIYYREHPEEIPAAQDAARDTVIKINKADCVPAQLPTVKGTP